jgi:hypothetical protein
MIVARSRRLFPRNSGTWNPAQPTMHRRLVNLDNHRSPDTETEIISGNLRNRSTSNPITLPPLPPSLSRC